MATTNSINSNIPIEIDKGGINTSSLSLTDGVVYFDGTKFMTISSLGASGEVLTSYGTGLPPAFGALPPPGGPTSFVNVKYARLGGAVTTGDGSTVTYPFDTTITDRDSNFNLGSATFTAPTTDKYFIAFSAVLSAVGLNYSIYCELITSNRTYLLVYGGKVPSGTPGSSDAYPIVVLADMDASDTAYFHLTGWTPRLKNTDISLGVTSIGPGGNLPAHLCIYNIGT